MLENFEFHDADVSLRQEGNTLTLETGNILDHASGQLHASLILIFDGVCQLSIDGEPHDGPIVSVTDDAELYRLALSENMADLVVSWFGDRSAGPYMSVTDHHYNFKYQTLKVVEG